MIPDGKASISQSLPQSLFVVYHDSQMRRALSILFVLLFGFGPLSATLGASDDTSLPACCRRHGEHHCAASMRMALMMAEAASGNVSLIAPSTCPLFPGYMAAATCASQALAASPVNLPALLAQTHSPAAGRAAARLSQFRTRISRGPPASSLA